VSSDEGISTMANAIFITGGILIIKRLLQNFSFATASKFIKFTPAKYPLIRVVSMTAVLTIAFSMCFSYAARKIKIIRTDVEPVAKVGYFCTGSCSFSPYGLQNCIF
jgi:hypothetical protein